MSGTPLGVTCFPFYASALEATREMNVQYSFIRILLGLKRRGSIVLFHIESSFTLFSAVVLSMDSVSTSIVSSFSLPQFILQNACQLCVKIKQNNHYFNRYEHIISLQLPSIAFIYLLEMIHMLFVN